MITKQCSTKKGKTFLALQYHLAPHLQHTKVALATKHAHGGTFKTFWSINVVVSEILVRNFILENTRHGHFLKKKKKKKNHCLSGMGCIQQELSSLSPIRTVWLCGFYQSGCVTRIPQHNRLFGITREKKVSWNNVAHNPAVKPLVPVTLTTAWPAVTWWSIRTLTLPCAQWFPRQNPLWGCDGLRYRSGTLHFPLWFHLWQFLRQKHRYWWLPSLRRSCWILFSRAEWHRPSMPLYRTTENIHEIQFNFQARTICHNSGKSLQLSLRLFCHISQASLAAFPVFPCDQKKIKARKLSKQLATTKTDRRLTTSGSQAPRHFNSFEQNTLYERQKCEADTGGAVHWLA